MKPTARFEAPKRLRRMNRAAGRNLIPPFALATIGDDEIEALASPGVSINRRTMALGTSLYR